MHLIRYDNTSSPIRLVIAHINLHVVLLVVMLIGTKSLLKSDYEVLKME